MVIAQEALSSQQRLYVSQNQNFLLEICFFSVPLSSMLVCVFSFRHKNYSDARHQRSTNDFEFIFIRYFPPFFSVTLFTFYFLLLERRVQHIFYVFSIVVEVMIKLFSLHFASRSKRQNLHIMCRKQSFVWHVSNGLDPFRLPFRDGSVLRQTAVQKQQVVLHNQKQKKIEFDEKS